MAVKTVLRKAGTGHVVRKEFLHSIITPIPNGDISINLIPRLLAGVFLTEQVKSYSAEGRIITDTKFQR
jgi:hypothetical protein